MDLNCERQRLAFILERDGAEEALSYADRMAKVYRAAALDRKRKCGRRDQYRYFYVESALSFRFLRRMI